MSPNLSPGPARPQLLPYRNAIASRSPHHTLHAYDIQPPPSTGHCPISPNPADLRSMQGCWHLIPQLVVIQSLSTGHHLIPLDCLPSDPSQLLAIQSRSTACHPIHLNCSPSDPCSYLLQPFVNAHHQQSTDLSDLFEQTESWTHKLMPSTNKSSYPSSTRIGLYLSSN
ncbi:hypothetical protein PtA15_1A80 [Puccinia triticina]|uniref:Uncharacterized protein n=1 Tax=Puccinia triticina TaxID=208348 RepID=A0ABY7CD47_9BASI|nr:uncharacterized protein PtA15_1A80 [Puccinia triticina]WAQ80742.1 hypothetical protein PtA15_1A80 [Puccinia triticina]